jgi:hypothetical protein
MMDANATSPLPRSSDRELGYIRGQLDLLKEQIRGAASAENSRFIALETKVDDGFRSLRKDMTEQFSGLGKRTADLATNLAARGLVFNLVDRITGWIIPAVLGVIGGVVLYHFGFVR